MTKIRRSAKGEVCHVRLPGICNYDPETTVLAHLRCPGTGVGRKPHDFQAVYACSACHEAIGDNGRKYPADTLRALLLTLETMHTKGLIKA